MQWWGAHQLSPNLIVTIKFTWSPHGASSYSQEPLLSPPPLYWQLFGSQLLLWQWMIPTSVTPENHAFPSKSSPLPTPKIKNIWLLKRCKFDVFPNAILLLLSLKRSIMQKFQPRQTRTFPSYTRNKDDIRLATVASIFQWPLQKGNDLLTLPQH